MTGSSRRPACRGQDARSDRQSPDRRQPHRLLPDEIRRVVWTYIRNAARAWNGVRVGEVTSTVTPWPHQVRTYQRLHRTWPCQMLIADEVGLGKTITAGLFIRQAWLSGRAQRILILMPRSLLTQWQSELYEKFNLNVPIYDGQKLVWKRDPRVARTGRTQGRPAGVAQGAVRPLPPAISCDVAIGRRICSRPRDWDLIVLDEAHHARRKSPGTPQEGGPNQLLAPDAAAPAQVPLALAAHGHADAGASGRALGLAHGCSVSPAAGRASRDDSSGTSPRRRETPARRRWSIWPTCSGDGGMPSAR